MRLDVRSRSVVVSLGSALFLAASGAAAQQQIPIPAPSVVQLPGRILAPDSARIPKKAPPKPRPPAPDRWDLSTEVGLTDQSGNRVLRLFTGALKFAHREKKKYRLDGRIQSRYGKSEGEVVARSSYGSLAFELHPDGHWSPFLSAESERDPIKRLDLRVNGGAGATYSPFREKNVRTATMSVGLLYSYENLSSKDETSPEPDPRFLARWNIKAQGQQKLESSAVTLNVLSLFQPAWGDMDDYLLRTEAGAKVSLTKRLALSIEYQLNRNAQPPSGVEPNDRLLKTGFVVDF
jgi:hypothetical protein